MSDIRGTRQSKGGVERTKRVSENSRDPMPSTHCPHQSKGARTKQSISATHFLVLFKVSKYTLRRIHTR